MKKRGLFLLTAVVLSITALSGCASKSTGAGETAGTTAQLELKETVEVKETSPAYPITVQHRLGTVTIEKEIETIAVFDLAMLDTLDKLGLGDKVAGIPKDSVFPEYLEKYKNDSYQNLGSLKELDMEAIYAMKPDLIMISGRQSDYYDQLSEIAPVISTAMDWNVPYMESVSENLSIVGTLFDKQPEIDGYLKEFESRLNVVNEKVKGAGYTAVVTMVSDRSMKSLGPNSRCSLISNEAGFTNLGADLEQSTHGDSINYEFILDKNPDYLFVLDRNAAVGATDAPAVREVVENELIRNTKAYENGNIVYLSPAPWYLAEGGISSTDAMITEIENAVRE